MKIRPLILGTAAVGCLSGLLLPQRAAAVVSDADFNALKNLVQQMGDKLQSLEQTNQLDQQTINQLQQRLGETQTLATNAVQTAAAAQVQATRPVVAGNSATHHVMMMGDAEIQFGQVKGQRSGFTLADFAPIFLYRANDNVLFEAGFDVTLQNGTTDGANNSGTATAVDLSFAQLDYLVNDYVTLVAGYDLLPLGTYSERTAGWLNKLPDDPLAVDYLPGAGVGAMLRGAVPVGLNGQSVNYSVYCVNGPSSVDGTGNALTTDLNGNTMPNLDLGGNVGIQSDGNSGNLHGNPSGGGRIGWFMPWQPHYDLELGVSGQTGSWDSAGKYLWSAAVLDAAVHLGPYFETKGEYISTWEQTADSGTLRPHGVWVQSAYKLAGFGLEMPVINDIELVGRYDDANDGLNTKTQRGTVGLVYYITNTLLFESEYEFVHSRGPAALPGNQFLLQLSYGF